MASSTIKSLLTVALIGTAIVFVNPPPVISSVSIVCPTTLALQSTKIVVESVFPSGVSVL